MNYLVTLSLIILCSNLFGAETLQQTNLNKSPETTNSKILFTIGKIDGSSAEFDGFKEGFKGYTKRLGDRDKLFLVGLDQPGERWTYILPGTLGGWAGMGYWSWRVNFASLAFTLETAPKKPCYLVINVAKVAPSAPLVRLEINGFAQDINLQKATQKKKLRFQIPAEQLHRGSNVIRLHSRAGDWLEFDAVSMVCEDESVQLALPRTAVVQNLRFSEKDDQEAGGKRQQALIVDVINTKQEGASMKIFIDGNMVTQHEFPRGRQAWEVMLPAVKKQTRRVVQVRDRNGVVSERILIQKPAPLARISDEVNMLAGTTNSRWMFTPGPSAPLCFMRLSPENEKARWKAGYDYQVESIIGFGHIHEWTMSGILTMPHHGKMFLQPGKRFDPDSGWRSRINPHEARAEIGKYSVTLIDTGIKAEMGATKRSSLERYTYPKSEDPRIICALQTGVDEYGTWIDEVHFELINPHEIRGFSVQRNKGSGYPEKQDYTVHFVMQFDQPVKRLDGWKDGKLETDLKKLDYKRSGKGLGDCGFSPVFDLPDGGVVQVRTGISLVDINGAANNLRQEIEKPFGWNLNKLVEANKKKWDRLLSRILIETHDRTRRSRFYTCLYRALSGRGICSDYDGRWRDASEKIQQAPQGVEMYSSDAMWGSHWNLNQLWNWVYPEISQCFMESQIQYFEKVGYTLKGPAGAEAIGVMLGSPEIPLMAGAWTAGVKPSHPAKLWQAVYHQQTTPGKNLPYGGFAGNEHYADYLKYGYIPLEGGGYAHYTSSTLEYAYQDWATAQLAKEMKRPKQEIDVFTQRAQNWKNAIHPERLLVQFKNKAGAWTEKSHCVEGSSSQLRWYVPHDTVGLKRYFGRGDQAVSILDQDFQSSEPLNYMAPADQMAAIKVNHGNQNMMHASYLFNAFGKPDLSQKWVRSILDRYYGYTAYDAYLGDEDQGQMSAWLNLSSIGVFSIDGGIGPDSMVEFIPPSFEKIRVKRPFGVDWIILATREVVNSGKAQSVTVNGKEIKGFRIKLSHLLSGDAALRIEWR